MKNQFKTENLCVLRKDMKVFCRGFIPFLFLMIFAGLDAKPMPAIPALVKTTSNYAQALEGTSDLAVVKSVSNSNPLVGTNVIFTVTANNKGPENATGVKVNDILDGGFTFVRASTTKGTWSAPEWNIGNLTYGASAVLTIEATVEANPLYKNSVTISGDQNDPFPADNSDLIEVFPVFSTPVVYNDYLAICHQTIVTGNLLSNGDYDPAGKSLTANAVPVSGPGHGTFTVNSNGSYTYVPTPGYSGTDRVVVKICTNYRVCVNDTLFLIIYPDITAVASPDTDLCGVTSVILAGNELLYGTSEWIQIAGPSPSVIESPDTSVTVISSLVPGTYRFEYRLSAGACTGTDTVVVNLWNPPVANAGDDATMCSDNYFLITDAAVHNAGSVHWTHNGKGTLTGENTLIPLYHSGVTEVGDVTFTLTVTPKGSGECLAATDIKVVTVMKRPQVICPEQSEYTYYATKGYCGYYIPDSTMDATHAGAWSADVWVNHDFFTWGNSHTLRGAFIPVGQHTIKWWVNSYLSRCTSDTCVIKVTVLDTVPPEFVNCPDGQEFTLGLYSNDCEGGAIWGIPIAKDDCSEVKVNQVLGPSPGTKLTPGKYPILYVATDASGNSDSCGFVLNVTDTEFPLLACQPSIRMENDPGVCTWTSEPHSLTPLLANSNCPYTITWEVTNPDGSISKGNEDVSGYIFQPGVSVVKYIIKENNGGQGDDCSFTVTVTDGIAPEINCPAPVSEETIAGVCDKDIKLLLPDVKDNCSTVHLTYRVYNPDNSIKGPFVSTSLTYKFMVGVSQVVWKATDASGNTAECYQEVRVTADNKDLVPNAGSDAVICEGYNWQLSGSAAPNTSVTWSTSGTGTFSNPNLLNPVYTPSGSDVINGQVILTLTAFSECASDIDHMILTITSYPEITAGPDRSLCAGESLVITDATSANAASVRWTTTGQGTLSGSNMLHPAYTPAAGEYGWLTFIVYAKGQGGCSSVEVSDTMKVIIHEPLMVKASDDISILYNTKTVLSVSVSRGSGVYSFEWKPTDKIYTYNTPRTETLPLLADSRFYITVTDDNWGCTGEDSVYVTVKTDIDDLITIYNAISPNSDGLNDIWWVEGITLFPENKVTIFNRWGDKIREFHKYDNQIIFWDGTNNQGKLVSDGTYYYVLEIKDIKTFTGWIQVKNSF